MHQTVHTNSAVQLSFAQLCCSGVLPVFFSPHVLSRNRTQHNTTLHTHKERERYQVKLPVFCVCDAHYQTNLQWIRLPQTNCNNSEPGAFGALQDFSQLVIQPWLPCTVHNRIHTVHNAQKVVDLAGSIGAQQAPRPPNRLTQPWKNATKNHSWL